MKKKFGLFGFCTAVAVASFFAAGLVACSDDSSANCAGSCIDSGDTIDITVPGDTPADSVKVDAKTEGSEDDGETKPASSGESKLASSSSEAAAASSAGEAPAASSTAEPVSSASEPAGSSAKESASSSSAKAPESSAAEEDWRDYCLEVVNAKRATEELPPLVRATTERETCVEKQAAADMEAGKGHANFGDCGEFAQNTGPNINTQWYGSEKKIVDAFVNMMWDDEKKLVTSGERDPDNKDDYSYIGHYLNMKNTKYKSLACGIYYSPDGKKAWFNMNFY